MKPYTKRILCILLLLPVFLAACSSFSASSNQPLSPPTDQPLGAATGASGENGVGTDSPESKTEPTQSSENAQASALKALEDAQGNVTVVVVPLDELKSEESLKFDVTLDTHSVDLSMDLAGLATLTTDTGKIVQPVSWDAPMGGHHVSGVLSFPATLDGEPILKGAQFLTLTLRDVDVPERTFTWNLLTP